jgi:hypothetical protein
MGVLPRGPILVLCHLTPTGLNPEHTFSRLRLEPRDQGLARTLIPGAMLAPGSMETMDRNGARATLKHYLDATDNDVAHEIYREDAVLEFPQSGERFEGVENFKAWRKLYPAKVYDGGPPWFGVSILEFRGDKVARETIYAGEGWEAPEWRAPWRAAPPPEQQHDPA